METKQCHLNWYHASYSVWCIWIWVQLNFFKPINGGRQIGKWRGRSIHNAKPSFIRIYCYLLILSPTSFLGLGLDQMWPILYTTNDIKSTSDIYTLPNKVRFPLETELSRNWPPVPRKDNPHSTDPLNVCMIWSGIKHDNTSIDF